ncbi:MAG: hypothetical protein JO092_10435 [Candidatus Eremiobacteraeota bacterium]|nr:hypothetical protein [Candidatus Eremiobacteraeota bacterium]MBV8374524.1 hypothetical protein [Candidatus Eremiobacteraeota bacterium]
MKVQIGVMGSAGGQISAAELQLARRIGRRIAERGCTIVTGACPGLPHAAVLGATEVGGVSLGVSPALSREEHVNVYGSPLQPYTAIVFTGSGLMGRETHNIHSSDFVIFVGGRSGTLGEFAIAYDEGKLIGVLTHSGGISDALLPIAKMVRKETGSIIITDEGPERLVDRCFEIYCNTPIPSAVAFNRSATFPVRRPRVTEETRSG